MLKMTTAKKRIYGLITAVVFAMTLLPLGGLFDKADASAAGTSDSTFSFTLQGDGTENSPYKITNKTDLENMRDAIANDYKPSNGENGKKSAVEAYYKLEQDIESLGEWTPIGRNGKFKGTFDGNGHKITGMELKNIPSDGESHRSDAWYYGLFGQIGQGGTVKNLTVEGDANISGGWFVGLIAGASSGTIENCYAKGSVNAVFQFGGIVGTGSNSTIKCCFADVTSTSTSTSSKFGAIAGAIGTVTDSCYVDHGNSAIGAPINDQNKNIPALTTEEAAKGKAAWILRQKQNTDDKLYWGQKLTEETEPKLYSTDEHRVYKAEFLLKTTDTTVTVAEEYANNDGHFTKPTVEYDNNGQTASDKWYTNEKLDTEYNFTEKVTQDIQLYSSESLKDYTITLDVNGGTLTDSNWTATGDGKYTKTYNKETESFDLPIPTAPEGQKFAGWVYNNANEAEKVTITKGTMEDRTYKAVYNDANGAEITVKLGDHEWKGVLSGVTVCVKEQKATVTATATDNTDNNVTLKYYKSDSALTEDQLKQKADNEWVVYEPNTGVEVTPTKKNKQYVYFKATDKDKNVTYASTAGIVFDPSAPTISGIADKGTYCESIEFTVDDNNLATVAVGEDVIYSADGTVVTDDSGIVATVIGNKKFSVKFEHDGSKEVIITAKDKAGNETTYNVTINGQHIKGRSVTEMTRQASCVNMGEGIKLTYCKTCGLIMERDDHYTQPMLEHRWTNWKEVSSELCGDTTMQRKCQFCGLTETKTEGGHHEWEDEYTVDMQATCLKPGQKSKHCKKCHIPNPDDTVEIPTLKHQAGSTKTIVVKEATCTTDGGTETVVLCENCLSEMGRTYSVIPATGHNFSDWEKVVTPSDPESGTMKRVCESCGYPETVSYHTEHKWGTTKEIDRAPTCTTEGSMSYHCENCGSTQDPESIPALGHKPREAVREALLPATCTEAGRYNDVIYCDTCNERISSTPVTVPAQGHKMGDWEEVVSQSTGEVNEQRKCEVCGYTETRGMDLENHKWNKESTIDVEPTCTTGGSESIHCSVCGLTKPGSSKPIPAKGHTWGEWKELVSPDCDDSGAQERECTVCSTKETKNLSPNGHTWEDHYTVDKAVTCLEDGSESIHCTKCDAVKESRTIPALGHHTPAAERKGAKAATPTEDGYTGDVVCEVCDEVLEKGEVIPATMGTLDVNSETGEGAPALKLSESDKLALEDAALTAEEKEALSNGADIDIILSIDDATATVTDNDKTLTDTAIAGKYTLGQFINIEITKKINGKEFAVTQLGKEISLTIVVPDSLKAEGRTYAIVRIHDGEADILSDIDSDEDTITFKTDKFSVYAIVYTDKAATPPTPDSSTPDSSLNDNSPATGGDFSLVFMILAAAVLGAICVIRKENKAR